MPAELVPTPAPVSPRRSHRWLAAGLGLLGCAAILIGSWALVPGRAPEPRAAEPRAAEPPPAQPGGDVLATVPAVRPARHEADELDSSFQEAWGRAGTFEGDLHRRADLPTQDFVSAIARSLADRAGALERGIASGRDASPAVPDRLGPVPSP
jgi:hypothetical protein